MTSEPDVAALLISLVLAARATGRIASGLRTTWPRLPCQVSAPKPYWFICAALRVKVTVNFLVSPGLTVMVDGETETLTPVGCWTRAL